MISAGVLLSFNLTNSALICVRREHKTIEGRCKTMLGLYNILAFISSLLLVYCSKSYLVRRIIINNSKFYINYL